MRDLVTAVVSVERHLRSRPNDKREVIARTAPGRPEINDDDLTQVILHRNRPTGDRVNEIEFKRLSDLFCLFLSTFSQL